MKKKNLLILALVAIVGIIAYIVITGKPQTAAEFERGNSFAVVPMNIKGGTTHHYLTDYYPQWEGADEVTTTD